MKLIKFLNEASNPLPTAKDIGKFEKESMLKAFKARPDYLKNTSMSSWLDYNKVEALPWTSKQHDKEANRLEQEYPNSATPDGRIAHALARLHRKVSGGRIFKKAAGVLGSSPLVRKLKSDFKNVIFGKEW